MKGLKVTTLRTSLSVKIGKTEKTFFDGDKGFSMKFLNDHIVQVTDDCNSVVYVPLTNIPFFTLAKIPKEKKIEQTNSKSGTSGTSKKNTSQKNTVAKPRVRSTK